MRGVIDIVNKRKIAGWVLESSNSSPLIVTLFINGKKIDSCTANVLRKNVVEKKLHSTGRCGFIFDLANLDFIPEQDNFEVRVNYKLPKSPIVTDLLFEKKRNKILKNKKVFFFTHIPKTAGTSFRNMLYKQFDQEKIFPNKHDIANNNNRYPVFHELKQNLLNRLDKVELFCGHYTIHNANQLFGEKNVVPIVFFRDPIERTISLLYQLKRMKPEYASESLENIFKKEPNQVTNVQSYYLTGKTPPNKMTDKDLEIALSVLNGLEVFGIAEEFNKSKSIIEKKYGWNLGPSKSLNKNPAKSKTISSEFLSQIKKANQLDIKLYEAVLERFKAL